MSIFLAAGRRPMTEFVEPNRPKIRPLDFLEPGRMLDLHAVQVPQLRQKRVGIIGTLSLMDAPDLEHVRRADWALACGP
jgi:hypothetical protein